MPKPKVCAQNQRCRVYAQTRRTLRQDGKGGHPIGGGRKKDERKETQQLKVFIFFWATSVLSTTGGLRLPEPPTLRYSGTINESNETRRTFEHDPSEQGKPCVTVGSAAESFAVVEVNPWPVHSKEPGAIKSIILHHLPSRSSKILTSGYLLS